jgi:nitroimidazol reductase NimA-like FMN-containing flavoprotein (pyridoxamine 5'-phosphate oxidase superfamily)
MERIVDELLTNRHTLRLATVGPDGTPHVVPLWFVSWKGPPRLAPGALSPHLSGAGAGALVPVIRAEWWG